MLCLGKRGEFLARAYEHAQEYRKILETEPDNIVIRNQLAYCYLKKEEQDKAFQEYKIILEQAPENEIALWEAGKILLSQGLLEQAREYFLKLWDKEKDNRRKQRRDSK